MVTEFFLHLATVVWVWVLSLIPDWDIPPEIQALPGQINAFLAQFSELGIWVPWAVCTVCVAVALGAWVLAFGVKGFAWAYGQVPVFGGSG